VRMRTTVLWVVGLVLAIGGAARADLLMHWDFDNVSGDTVTNTGTLGVSADGKMASGVTVVNDLTFGNVAQYNATTNAFMWMGPSGVGIPVGEVATVAAFYKGTDFDYWMDRRSPRRALIAGFNGDVRIYDGAWESTGYGDSNLEDHRWHHVAVTVNGSGAVSNGLAPGAAELFVDGVSVGTASGLDDWDLNTGSTTIWGAHNTGTAANTSGLHHDVRIYDEVLSDGDIAALATIPPQPPVPTDIKIDIDSTSLSSSNHGGTILTEPGWTSLDATMPSEGDSVSVGGVTFTTLAVFSSDGSRVRMTGSAPNPNALTADFLYDDGNGQAVGLRVYNLPDGLWDAKVWSWDQTSPAGGQIVGLAYTGGPEIILTDDFTPHPTDPYTFQFDSSTLPDGFGIFTRESAISGNDRARFNALQLTLVPPAIPEPITMLAVGLGVAGLGRYVRKRENLGLVRRSLGEDGS